MSQETRSIKHFRHCLYPVHKYRQISNVTNKHSRSKKPALDNKKLHTDKVATDKWYSQSTTEGTPEHARTRTRSPEHSPTHYRQLWTVNPQLQANYRQIQLHQSRSTQYLKYSAQSPAANKFQAGETLVSSTGQLIRYQTQNPMS
jgi:hypothetical protein